MSVSIMMTSDWHVDAKTAGVPRFVELQDRVTELVKEAVTRKCEHFMFLGDFHDPDSVEWWKYQKLLAWTVITLANAGIRSHWVQGNHDVVKSLSSTYSTLSVIHELTNALKVKPYLYEEPTCRPADNKDGLPFNLVALPYPSMASYNADMSVAASVRSFVPKCKRTYTTIVISHMQLSGMVPGSESREMARGVDHELPMTDIALLPNVRVFQGHYHRHQQFTRCGVDVTVVGSLARLHFDEEDHNPGFVQVNT